MNNKFIKFFFFKLKLLLLKLSQLILEKYQLYVVPNISQKLIFKYDVKSHSFISKKKDNIIDTIKIETSEYSTDLCILGKKFFTDKSPYNTKGHRHPYTPIYDLLFSSFKNDKFNFLEIGILNNSSIKMFRRYFKNANLYGFEFNKKFINNALDDKLKKTTYKHINVKDEKSIKKTFNETNKFFKIIIDDSTHEFEDQLRIIDTSKKYLEPGGILVIEDIFHNPNYLEKKYFKKLRKYKRYFEKIYFIECNHFNKYSPGWNNDKLLILKNKN
jgi:hypothetical protein